MQNLSNEDIAKLKKFAKESEERGHKMAIADGVDFDRMTRKREVEQTPDNTDYI